MYLSKEEKARRIIDLYYNQGKTYHEIVKELKVSPNFVNAVLKKHEEEVTQFYKGFLKLKGLYKFSIIYEKYIHHIPRLLKLCTEAEKEGVSIEQLLKLSELAADNNPVGLSQLEKLR